MGAATAPDRILGIDEAGRGSVIGPLVVGAFLVRRDRLGELRAAGARDSKTLRPEQRRSTYERLAAVGECRAALVSPREIDRFVRHGGLNLLEAREFARLVATFAPDEVRVDACDVDAERFGRRIRRMAGAEVPVLSRHNADRDDLVVGAASIVAKVRRDRAVAALRQRLGADFGSGYPSDPRTVAFVEVCLRAGGSFPPYLRRSWSTMQRVKAAVSARTLDDFES